MAQSSFLVPVAHLVAEPGSRRRATVDELVSWGFELAEVGPELHADLLIENASGVLVVRGTVRTELGLTCHRCLTEWIDDVDVVVTEAFGFDEDAGSSGEDYELRGDVLDLEPMLRDVVLLEVPLRPLCREGCLGLCATCGTDLNGGPHPEHQEESTSPFAVLRDLLEP